VQSSERSRKRAAVMDADVTRITGKALAPLGAVGINIRSATIRAIRNGDKIGPAIRNAMKPMRDPLIQGMTAAYVIGQARTDRARRLTNGLVLARKVPDNLGVFKSVSEFATQRLDISKAELRGVGNLFRGNADQALKSMGGFLEERIRAAVADSVKRGLTSAGTIEEVRKAFDEAGVTNAKPFLIETQARTQSQLAYSAGRLKANEDPAIQEELWGYEYVTVGDDRVRPGHAALDGLRLTKDNPKWGEIMPPNGWNCRCSFIEIFNDQDLASELDAEEFVTVDGVRTRAGADEGFDFNPLDIFNQQTAILK